MKSWYTIRARTSGTEVLIYDEIGAYGVTAKGFLAELAALPDDAAIDLRLNASLGSARSETIRPAKCFFHHHGSANSQTLVPSGAEDAVQEVSRLLHAQERVLRAHHPAVGVLVRQHLERDVVRHVLAHDELVLVIVAQLKPCCFDAVVAKQQLEAATRFSDQNAGPKPGVANRRAQAGQRSTCRQRKAPAATEVIDEGSHGWTTVHST